MRDILKVLCESPRKAGGERVKAIKEYIVSRLIDSYEVIEKKYPFTGWELLKEPEFTFLKPINKKSIVFQLSGRQLQQERFLERFLHFLIL